MANEEQNVEDKQALGAPEGVSNKDLSQGESHEGPKAPVINNAPPAKEPTAEEKAAAEKATAEAAAKEAADKEIADKAAADKKAADEEAEKNKEPLKEFPVYDDPVANSVVNLLKKAGVTPVEADTFFSKAVESGDLKDIDLTALVDKVGKDEADLIMIGVKDYHSRNSAAVKLVVDEVHKITGGEEQFTTLKNWALEKEKVDPKFSQELDEYRRMLDGTPTQARLAAQELLKAYNADPKTKSLNIKLTEGDKSGSNNLSLDYISRADYIVALQAADDKKDAGEVARLNARRLQSVKAEKERQR